VTYARSNLHRIGGAIPGLSIYKSADAIATTAASGYFNSATNELYQGDVIILVDTNVGTVDVAMVSSADQAATVTVVNGT
jgi:carbamoylphosphate synthase small subunit